MAAAHYSELLDYGLSKPKVSFDRADRNPATRIRARAATIGFFVGHIPDFAFHAVFQHAHIAPSQLARITMTRFANSKSVAQRAARKEQQMGPRPVSHRAISPVVVWRRNLAAEYKVRSASDAGRAVTGFSLPFVWHAGLGAGIVAFGGGFPAVGALTWAFAVGGGVTRWGFPYVMDNPRAHRLVHSFEEMGSKSAQWGRAVRYQGRHRHVKQAGRHRAPSRTTTHGHDDHRDEHHNHGHSDHRAHDHRAHDRHAHEDRAHDHAKTETLQDGCHGHGHERRHMTVSEAESVMVAALGPCPTFGTVAYGPWKSAAVAVKTLVRGKPLRFEVIPEAGARVKLAYALADAIETSPSLDASEADLSMFDDGIRSCVETLLDPTFKSHLETSRYQTRESVVSI